MMNVSQLRYIVSVEKERNFARAAKACHVTQPTLSKEIQKLEHKLDALIFDRSCSPVVPTEKGNKLIMQARQVLAELDRFEQIAKQNHDELTGELKLGVCASISPYLLPLFLPQFSRQHPKLHINVQEMSVAVLHEKLIQGELDSAICPMHRSNSNMFQLILGDEDYLAYVSEKNPLFKNHEVSFKQAVQHGLQLASDVAEHIQCDSKSFDSQLNTGDKNLVLEFGSLETLRRFVELGSGITLIPSLASLYMGERRKQFLRPLAEPKLYRTLVMSTRRGFQKREILDALLRAIKSALKETKSRQSFNDQIRWKPSDFGNEDQLLSTV